MLGSPGHVPVAWPPGRGSQNVPRLALPTWSPPQAAGMAGREGKHLLLHCRAQGCVSREAEAAQDGDGIGNRSAWCSGSRDALLAAGHGRRLCGDRPLPLPVEINHSLSASTRTPSHHLLPAEHPWSPSSRHFCS